MKKKPANRETIKIDLCDFTHLNESSLEKAAKAKKEMTDNLIMMLEQRFSSFEESVFKNMEWLDPKNWSDEHEYGHDQIQAFANHFSILVANTAYESNKVLHEWKRFRIFVKANYQRDLMEDKTNAKKIWKHILNYRRKEFPHLCFLMELVCCISGSNSSVERGFSVLTAITTDRRIHLNHSTIAMIMNIKCNDHLWSEAEKSEIIDKALDIHLLAERKHKMDDEQRPKKQAKNDFVVVTFDGRVRNRRIFLRRLMMVT